MALETRTASSPPSALSVLSMEQLAFGLFRPSTCESNAMHSAKFEEAMIMVIGFYRLMAGHFFLRVIHAISFRTCLVRRLFLG